MNEAVREALHEIGRLLRDHPTTGALSRDEKGKIVDYPESSEACSWCLLGARERVAQQFTDNREYLEFNKYFTDIVFGNKLSSYIEIWEGPGTSDETRRAIAEKLLNA